MSRRTFQQRLATAMRGGNLTVADLARWFEVPYQTAYGWVRDGHRPWGGAIDLDGHEDMLVRLEVMVRKREGFPLRRLAPRHRIATLAGIRSRALKERTA